MSTILNTLNYHLTQADVILNDKKNKEYFNYLILAILYVLILKKHNPQKLKQIQLLTQLFFPNTLFKDAVDQLKSSLNL